MTWIIRARRQTLAGPLTKESGLETNREKEPSMDRRLKKLGRVVTNGSVRSIHIRERNHPDNSMTAGVM